ncbi:MAG: LysM peptidoglycan-binding domain-containing protein [Lachnospiraceae bacterium]|jgi:spore germination protein|nr:LysM peptidoglycan-binding domain-containing protein [Lachnospiraceae bacterium]
MQIYVVKEGDNVDKIASAMGIAVETLIYDNQIPYPYRLAVGQALFIGRDSARFMGGTYWPWEDSSKPGAGNPVIKPPLYVSGYAYPFIQDQVLEDTLPGLTAIYVFSYGFTMEGELIPPSRNEDWLLAAARQQGVRPVLTLTPLGSDGHFNNNLVSALVHSCAVQQKLVWALGSVMQKKGYQGLDIDFEYVQSQDREAFAGFVDFTTQVMNLFGYPVSVALAPKTSRNQTGLLYEGVDYRLLGEAANRVMLMTYEWGYTYGPPMAVAPIHMVRRVVEYAVSEILPKKISLGIPNYGYDWPLPYVRGTTKATTLGTLEAIQLAIDHGAEIRFDELSQSPYFRYWQYGIQHEVWFEDVRSLKAKFDLVKEYGLSGVGYWQLMRYFRANWLMLEDLFVTEKGIEMGCER